MSGQGIYAGALFLGLAAELAVPRIERGRPFHVGARDALARQCSLSGFELHAKPAYVDHPLEANSWRPKRRLPAGPGQARSLD